MMNRLVCWAWIAAMLLATGCKGEDGDETSPSLPDPSEPRVIAPVNVPNTPDPSGDPAETNNDSSDPADPGDGIDAQPLPLGAREVELSVNGEQVQVIRPSLANPFVVAGGEYDGGEPVRPQGSGDADGPVIAPVAVHTIDVIRRVPQTVDLSVEDRNGVGDILGYYVVFEGYPGHFFIPAEIDSEIFGASQRERGRFSLGFFLDEVFPPGTRSEDWAQQYHQDFQVPMTIWAVDRDRNLSAPVTQMLHILPVGNGDLEVTLSMSMPTDLDLYVVEPNGNVIYYGNLSSYTQGRLDLDANAACASNLNVRYEHIFWPAGQVPEGTYQIRVDNWENCVGGQAVDFQVIVQNCGDITVYDGTAVGRGGGGDCVYPGQPSCQSMATIQVEECELPPDNGM